MVVVPFGTRNFVKAVIGLDGRILRPGSFLESLGYGRRIFELGFLDITHPEDCGISKAVHDWLHEGHSRLIVAKRYVAAGGRVVRATVHIEVVHDARGRPRYMRSWPARAGPGWGAASRCSSAWLRAGASAVHDGFVAAPVRHDPRESEPGARCVGRLPERL